MHAHMTLFWTAIADYQRANGLVETSAIDQPTLESLGMA
jgi:hypothetical protein